MNWFHKLSAQTKLLLSFFMVCSTLGGVSGFALYKMGEINNSIGVVYNEQLVPISALGKTQLIASAIRQIGTISALPAEKEQRQKDLATIENSRKEFVTLYEGTVGVGRWQF